MNRQKAVICIAKINRYSLQIAIKIKTTSVADICTLVQETRQVSKWGDEIISYINKSKSDDIVREILNINRIDNISTLEVPKETKTLLDDFIQTINILQEYAEDFQIKYRKGPYEKLIEEFAYREAKDVFTRIWKAGLLDEDFKLKRTTTRIQAHVLGWSIIQILELPKRKSWAVIERQWNCGRIGNIPLPEKKTREIDKVKSIFPELDYSGLFAEPADKYFEIHCSDEVVSEVFLALVTYGFISRKTKFCDFQSIFNKKNCISQKTIDWKKSIRLLTYFVYYAFCRTNTKYLERTRYCFTVKGKPINKGTLKSSSSFAVNSGEHNEIMKGLKQIALKFAVKGETPN